MAKISAVALIAMLAVPSVAAPQSQRSDAVLTTKHFAFYSDLATNVNDALIAAAGARRAKQQEPFAAGPDRACFDALPAADRSRWTRAVDYYAEEKSSSFQRVLLRLELAGLLQREGVSGEANRQFLEEVAAIREGATPAYSQCRWRTQDAVNRRWIDRLEPLLAAHETVLGTQLPLLFQVPWAGLPFRVDVVETVGFTGANSASPAGNTTFHILISSTNSGNQDRAALELVFHEATHALATDDSPLARALSSAIRETGGAPQPSLLHQVHFFMTGEAVSRALATAGGTPYVPYLYSLRLFGDRFRDAAARVWPAYMNGTRTLRQTAGDLVRALAEP